jgi:amino acid permease
MLPIKFIPLTNTIKINQFVALDIECTENYKSWIIATTNHRRKGISSVTLIIFSVWALIAVAFRDIVPGQFDLLFKMVGLTLFVVWTTVDLLSYLVKRKYR